MGGVFDIGLYHFLVVSVILASAGVATMLTKRNAIGILIGVELVLNAAGINLVAFAYFTPWASGGPQSIDGLMFATFIIVLAAAEAAVALAIFLNFYNNFDSIDVERADQLRG